MRDLHLADRIKHAMAQAGLSPQALADAVGVSRPTVTYWTHPDPDKRKRPDDEHLAAIAKACGVELSWLRGDDEGALCNDVEVLKPRPPRPSALEGQVLERVRSAAPPLGFGFRRHIAYPGMDPKHFDYVSASLIAEIKASTKRLPATTLRSLWNLAVIASLDSRMHTGRYHVLLLISEDQGGEIDALTNEASALSVEIVTVPTAEKAAEYIVSFEQRS